MPYLKLLDQRGRRILEARDPVARLGRDPDATFVFPESKVVSGRHAEIRYHHGAWHVVDVGSRNGTFVNGRRIAVETALAPGDAIALGESGPSLTVLAVGEGVEPTVPERPGLAVEPPEARAYAVTLIAAATGRRFEARGVRIRLGRGRECEIRLEEPDDTTVSRVHAELTVGPGGGLVVRDVGSRNGTFLNGARITTPVPVRLGDELMFGPGGPALLVEGLGTAPVPAVPRPGVPGVGRKTAFRLISDALAQARAERRRGGRGSTAFLRAVAAEMGRDSGRRMRWLVSGVMVLALLLGGGVVVVYRVLAGVVERTEQTRRTAADSARRELERLRSELAEARAAAVPAAQVESLRAALDSAQARTLALQAGLARAQDAVAQQLAAGEASRRASGAELARLRDELAAAQLRAPSPALIDSLRRAVSAAEARSANLDAKLRAIRGTDFAAIAQQAQSAVGLITVALDGAYYDGTGFVISPDGYMLTNWHVVVDSAHAEPDTMWVTMADQSAARLADVVATSSERDLAVVKIRSYAGPHLGQVDWTGTRARQGEPAALIGFPAGSGFARDRASVVRTSMTAGILSRVTADLIQFDGMTIGGSSGSPVFNASGEVVSVHRAGLRQAQGFALSVPVRYAIPLLPAELRRRLGVP